MINSKNRYYTNAGNAGSKFSGGERQRLTIARALLKDSLIVVLDEATAYSDPENEAIIQQSIDSLFAKMFPLSYSRPQPTKLSLNQNKHWNPHYQFN